MIRVNIMVVLNNSGNLSSWYKPTADVRMSILSQLQELSNLFKSSFGPDGRAKIISHGKKYRFVYTGNEILKELNFISKNPVLNMLASAGETQWKNCGDGSLTSILLTGALLKNAEKLLKTGFYPSTIIEGYNAAANKSLEILNARAIRYEKDKAVLRDIALSALKNVVPCKEKVASLIAAAVFYISKNRGAGGVSRGDIDIQQQYRQNGGSKLCRGILLKQKRVRRFSPSCIRNAKILILDYPLDSFNEIDMVSRVPMVFSRGMVRSVKKRESFEKLKLSMLIEAIENIENTGADIVICESGVGNLAAYYLEKRGIWALERVNVEDICKLSRVTGAIPVSSLYELSPNTLGEAKAVMETEHRKEKGILVVGSRGAEIISIFIEIGPGNIYREVSKNIENAVAAVCCTVNDRKVLPGGGKTESLLHEELIRFGLRIDSRLQEPVLKFADALMTVPEVLEENYGKSSGENNYRALDPHSIKISALKIACDTATSVLRIDSLLPKKPDE